MKTAFKTLLITAALAGATATSFAMGMGGGKHCMMGEGMGPMGMGGGPGGGMHQRMDPAKREAYMAKRMDELKAKLKITASQEAAWTSFTSAMKPPAHKMDRPDPAEMAKLPTPERIDKMNALHTQHQSEMNAAMTQRGNAVKTLYAALSPEQQKQFDEVHTRTMERRGPMGGHHRGPGAGGPGAGGPGGPRN